VPVFLLPHSKTSTDTEFRYHRMAALTHPMQGCPVFNPAGRALANHALSFPETWNASTHLTDKIATVSLLLNAQSLNGIPFTSWKAYLQGIREIVACSKELDIELKIRCKPSYSFIGQLSQELGLNPSALRENVAEPMEQHIAGCDLCLLYDAPSSANLQFLKNGVPILNPIVEPLAPAEQAMGNSSVFPTEGIEATLERLRTYVAEPLLFHDFRLSQFRNYVKLFEHASALRTFL